MADSVYILDKQALKPENIPAGAVGVWVDNSGRVRTVDEAAAENPVGPNTASDFQTAGADVAIAAGAQPTGPGQVMASLTATTAGFQGKFPLKLGAEFEIKNPVNSVDAVVVGVLDEWALLDPGTLGANQTYELPDPAGAGAVGRSCYVMIDGPPGAFKATVSSPSGPLVLGNVDLTVEGEAAQFTSDGTSWRQTR